MRNTLNALSRALGDADTREDGSQLHPQSLSYFFDEAVREARLPRIRFHDLRHTAATIRLARGAPTKAVQEMLGHSSASITLDVYAHVTEDIQEATAELAVDPRHVGQAALSRVTGAR